MREFMAGWLLGGIFGIILAMHDHSDAIDHYKNCKEKHYEDAYCNLRDKIDSNSIRLPKE